MRVKALAIRILKQLRYDRKTVALMIFAPMLMLSLVFLILDQRDQVLTIAAVNAPEKYIMSLEDRNFIVVRASESEAANLIKAGDAVASINIVSGKIYVNIDGTNQANTEQTLNAIERAKAINPAIRTDLITDVKYIYGSSDFTAFDSFGSILIGFIIFFFVFLVAGISFLQERTSGTLERLLSTPIKRWEIVVGYVLGFGVFTIIQAIIITIFAIYVLNIMMVGSFATVLFIAVISAIVALTLGMVMSTLASNELQIIQFIPIIIIPQFFFSGLFELSDWLAALGKVMPLYYMASALKGVMLKGEGIIEILPYLIVLFGFIFAFMSINVLVLKKYRKI